MTEQIDGAEEENEDIEDPEEGSEDEEDLHAEAKAVLDELREEFIQEILVASATVHRSDGKALKALQDKLRRLT